ncbi:MAG TPA: S8 family serine peptidase [Bradyrhizobium sp.]|nr:S8 family serine peptidase [Bradyrhizobium sp.]
MRSDAAQRRAWVRVMRRFAIGAAVLLPLLMLGNLAEAQGFIRSPNLNIAPRVPAINAGDHGPRINPHLGNIGVTRVPRPALSARSATIPVSPYAHYSPNLYPACSSAYRDSDGECLDAAVSSSGGGSTSGKKHLTDTRRSRQTATVPSRSIAGELVAEIDGTLSDAQMEALARRHGLARITSQTFPLIGATIGLFRITDRRSVEAASRDFASETSVHAVQPNFRYLLQDQKAAPSEGDAAQYALAKLHLPEAHTLAHGEGVRIAIIDSGIDARHPELAGSIIDSFDALGSKQGPHVHGTGIAGVIVSHARLMGSAPSAKIIAIRAFGQAGSGAESNSYVILKALDYAAGHGAQIINMSFAGPKDALIERGITATAARGEVMIAAAGNAGPKSPPLYPAANPKVIAVSATDAQDKLFAASNRGSYVALAAPGVDIFLPAPDGKYQITSGTSFSAAFVSGLAALMLERNPQLKADDVRSVLTSSARDLGSPGRDDEFGAGEADAYAAVKAAMAPTGVPSASSEPGKAAENAPELKENAKENPSVTSVASDKSTAAEARGAAPQ